MHLLMYDRQNNYEKTKEKTNCCHQTTVNIDVKIPIFISKGNMFTSE
jgi:hypothetical protein